MFFSNEKKGIGHLGLWPQYGQHWMFLFLFICWPIALLPASWRTFTTSKCVSVSLRLRNEVLDTFTVHQWITIASGIWMTNIFHTISFKNMFFIEAVIVGIIFHSCGAHQGKNRVHLLFLIRTISYRQKKHFEFGYSLFKIVFINYPDCHVFLYNQSIIFVYIQLIPVQLFMSFLITASFLCQRNNRKCDLCFNESVCAYCVSRGSRTLVTRSIMVWCFPRLWKSLHVLWVWVNAAQLCIFTLA